MSDAVFWLLLVAAILAVQGTEPAGAEEVAEPVGAGLHDEPAAQETLPGITPPPPPPRARPGWSPQAGAPVRSFFGPGGGAAQIARIGVAAAAAIMVLVGLLTLASAQAGSGAAAGARNQNLVGGALQLGAGAICLALFFGGTARVPGLRRIREGAPISWLAILLFCESLAVNLTPSSGQDTVKQTVNVSSGPSAESLMLGAVPFLAIGVASVGPVVRRTLLQTAERLGLWPLRLPWWVVGLVVGVVLVPLGDQVANLLSHLTTANCLAQQSQVEQAITGTGRTALEQIGVAVAAGVCEETLFRGALQPRFGILLSSALWASYHLQYTCNGLPSASNLYILLLGFAFGGLRKAGGLWPAILAHTAYDGIILLGWL